MGEPEYAWGLDVGGPAEWRPSTLKARLALSAIDAALRLKNRSYRVYLLLAGDRRLGRVRVHAPFEVLYSLTYLALRRAAFPGSNLEELIGPPRALARASRRSRPRTRG